MGCSLATSLVSEIKKFRRDIDPDFLFIEPSEIVLTHEMRNASSMGLRDIRYESGPFITLVDGPAFDLAWEERGALIKGQVANADLVAVSRSDLIEAAQSRRIAGILSGYAERIILMSAIEGSGVNEVLQILDLHQWDIK